MSKLLFQYLAMSFFATVWSVNIAAQDIIYLLDGEEIESKITEISDSEIRYKKFSYIDGPTYIINTDKVFMLVFENGSREVINPVEKANDTPEQIREQSAPVVQQVSQPKYALGDTILYYDNDQFHSAVIIGFHTSKPLTQIEFTGSEERLLVKNTEVFKKNEIGSRAIKVDEEYCCNETILNNGDKVIVYHKGKLQSVHISQLHPSLDIVEVTMQLNNEKAIFPFEQVFPANEKNYTIGNMSEAGQMAIYFDGMFKNGMIESVKEYSVIITRYYRVNGIEYTETNKVPSYKVLVEMK